METLLASAKTCPILWPEWGGWNMTDFLPKEVRDGLAAAQKANLKRSSRIRVHVGENAYSVLRLSETGFSLDAENAPRLRGLVDLYEGPNHLYQCLIVASSEEDGEMVYEFKRNTAAADKAPLDFHRPVDAPIALLGSS